MITHDADNTRPNTAFPGFSILDVEATSAEYSDYIWLVYNRDLSQSALGSVYYWNQYFEPCIFKLSEEIGLDFMCSGGKHWNEIFVEGAPSLAAPYNSWEDMTPERATDLFNDLVVGKVINTFDGVQDYWQRLAVFDRAFGHAGKSCSEFDLHLSRQQRQPSSNESNHKR